MHRLPYVYALLIVAEVAFLLNRYLTDPPPSSHPFSVALGWVGIGSMVALLVYSVARRSRALRRWARLSYWLHFHIFLAVQGVVGALFHSWHLVDRPAINLLNPALLSGALTIVIFCSGLFGRYLYSLLPRTLGGVQMQAQDVDEELRAATAGLTAEAREIVEQPAPEPKGFIGLIRADFAARAALRELKRQQLPLEKLGLAERRLKLMRRRAALRAAEPIFRLWIVLHRPLAGILYVVALVHIAFAYMFSSALSG